MVEDDLIYLLKRVKPCPYCGDIVEMEPIESGMWTLKCKDHLYVITSFTVPKEERHQPDSKGT